MSGVKTFSNETSERYALALFELGEDNSELDSLEKNIVYLKDCAKIAEIIENNSIGLVVLAGFMKIIPKSITDKYDGMILNLHPSLLPKHKGLDTHQKVIQAKDKFHGASVHYVTSKLDNGPVIIQGKYEVDDYDENIMREQVHKIEYQILPIAIKWFVDGNITKLDNRFSFNKEVLECPIQHILDH